MKHLMLAVLSASLFACAETPKAERGTEIPYGLWVWSAEASGNEMKLVVERTSNSWRAALNDAPAVVFQDADEIVIAGPAKQEFRGKLSGDDSSITGYWLQPMTNLGYSDMITKVSLEPDGTSVWSASFTEQKRPFHIFLEVFEDEAGTPKAVIRNPERNEIMAAAFDVAADENGDLVLTAGDGEWQLRQSLKQTGPDRLSLEHNWFDNRVTLRPASPEDTVSYFSRAQSKASSEYTWPEQLDDGWAVASADTESYDWERFNALVSELAATDPKSRRPNLIHSLLVAHEGKLVVEEYFNGYSRETPHDTRSLAKVFGPVLMGAMRQSGVPIDPAERPIEGILAAAGETPDDPRKRDITLHQLMTYSSGLDCDASSGASAGNEDNMWSQTEEPDFWRYIARVDQLHTPGTRYAYCSGSINMVASALTERSGLPLYEAFDIYIAKPLQFGTYHWNLAPNGQGYMGGGVYMRPRDILKIGAMYLNDGVWNGQQITSPEWIETSTSPKIDISPETTGLTQDEFSNNYFGGQQAYVWRVDSVTSGGKTYDSYEATGNGGQILLIVPELDLSVVFTGGNYRWGSIWGRWRNDIVGRHVIPALNLDG